MVCPFQQRCTSYKSWSIRARPQHKDRVCTTRELEANIQNIVIRRHILSMEFTSPPPMPIPGTRPQVASHEAHAQYCDQGGSAFQNCEWDKVRSLVSQDGMDDLILPVAVAVKICFYHGIHTLPKPDGRRRSQLSGRRACLSNRNK